MGIGSFLLQFTIEKNNSIVTKKIFKKILKRRLNLFMFYFKSYLFNCTFKILRRLMIYFPRSERIQDHFDKRNRKKEFIWMLQEFNDRFGRSFPILVPSFSARKFRWIYLSGF
ncbi:hypothetical protein LEP1GSC066_3820 [Leptospira sp. serovar Kenya str. Sh9]|uniref:Uncharacterized protein n=1 Tax=Leptospira borgpetersenii str. 200701203 TaxID=1193007 RepID=M3GEN9_LEPBO|nr:hypothetical protein LEP1GSC101_3123 [Leptospira borgpetersenii str. UI 09149]EMF99406.1 hypothetical protein LEP1GSC123_4660 [Leptospira borgpetersenii str. 200701203]EMK13330.1 hypothetical protein LEP1GSC066_3820 [Leptospira sp. serovar Kenya str. Sh9]EMN59435.1 hypothetical protein LEP1GSC090_1476 [Leptospira borgpetersenii serovar Javanica str. MK146]